MRVSPVCTTDALIDSSWLINSLTPWQSDWRFKNKIRMRFKVCFCRKRIKMYSYLIEGRISLVQAMTWCRQAAIPKLYSVIDQVLVKLLYIWPKMIVTTIISTFQNKYRDCNIIWDTFVTRSSLELVVHIIDNFKHVCSGKFRFQTECTADYIKYLPYFFIYFYT